MQVSLGRKLIQIGLAVIFIVSLRQVTANEYLLLEQLNYIRGQEEGKVGRDSKVKAYEQFIQRAGSDPLAAEAMIDVAGIYKSIAMPELGIEQDLNESLSWYRKAVAFSKTGSDGWIKGQMGIVSIIQIDKPAEAHQILNKIQEETPGNNLVQVKVENMFVTVCRSEHDLESADKHARKVLEWYGDPNHIPKQQTEKDMIDKEIAMASNNIMGAWSQAHNISYIERAEKINSLLSSYSSNKHIYSAGTRSLSMLRSEIEQTTHQKATEELIKSIDPYSVLPPERGNISIPREKKLINEPLPKQTEDNNKPKNITANLPPRIPTSGPVQFIPPEAYMGVLTKDNPEGVSIVEVRPAVSDLSSKLVKTISITGFGTMPEGLNLTIKKQIPPTICVTAASFKIHEGKFEKEITVKCLVDGKPFKVLLRVYGLNIR